MLVYYLSCNLSIQIKSFPVWTQQTRQYEHYIEQW
jgi:hypothetical protein